MLLSRGLPVLRIMKHHNINTIQSLRNGHQWSYRSAPPPASKVIMGSAVLVQGIAWWWVLWHIYTEPGHLIGEFDYPDPRKWSDEELGIPPKG